jgi:hypothetical protein
MAGTCQNMHRPAKTPQNVPGQLSKQLLHRPAKNAQTCHVPVKPAKTRTNLPRGAANLPKHAQPATCHVKLPKHAQPATCRVKPAKTCTTCHVPRQTSAKTCTTCHTPRQTCHVPRHTCQNMHKLPKRAQTRRIQAFLLGNVSHPASRGICTWPRAGLVQMNKCPYHWTIRCHFFFCFVALQNNFPAIFCPFRAFLTGVRVAFVPVRPRS